MPAHRRFISVKIAEYKTVDIPHSTLRRGSRTLCSVLFVIVDGSGMPELVLRNLRQLRLQKQTAPRVLHTGAYLNHIAQDAFWASLHDLHINVVHYGHVGWTVGRATRVRTRKGIRETTR